MFESQASSSQREATTSIQSSRGGSQNYWRTKNKPVLFLSKTGRTERKISQQQQQPVEKTDDLKEELITQKMFISRRQNDQTHAVWKP